MTAKELLAIAKAEVGIKENPANSNSVKYNTWMYGRSVQDGIPKGASYPWCAAFVSWCFRGTGLCPKTASCLNMLEWFEKNGQIVKEPRPGDIVFFKYSTNKRRTNHVGIVVSVSGKIINTYEGNTSANGSQDNGGMVMQKNRYSNIVAFARPKYETEGKTEERPMLKLGSKGKDVLYLHKQLKKLKYGVNENSDYFDSTTRNCILHLQASNFLEVDGVVGPLTWKVIDGI